MSAVHTILQKSTGRTLQSLRTKSLQNAIPQCFISAWHHTCREPQKKCLLDVHKPKHKNSYSTEKSKVLSQSSILLQDGLGFEELPILMRRATKESFPFTSYSYAGSAVKEESEFDISFRQALQSCGSVKAVFKLLEVPQNQVEGYSAAFALQRLHELKSLNTDWQQIHSFIRSAVMRELYDRVQEDVKLLSCNTLISLVECYLAADGFSVSCMDSINEEIQARLADNAPTISEILTLAEVLKENKSLMSKPKPLNADNTTNNSDFVSHTLSVLEPTYGVYQDDYVAPKPQHFDKFSAKDSSEVRDEMRSKCQELLQNVWIHLVSRYSEVDEHTLPLVLQALSTEQRSVVSLLEKPAASVWADMTPDGVKACLDSLCRLRVHNSSLMVQLGRWAYIHIHEINSALLLSFLHTYTKFTFLDQNLIRVLEKLMQIKGTQVQNDVLTMSVDYCMTCRYLSPTVLDTAAAHLAQHGDSYHPLQLYAVVRAFGYLNYLPAKPASFLKKAESCLWTHFDNMSECQILEILGSLTFINVLPKNFYKRVTSAYFYTKVGALTNPEKARALMWLRVLKHAVALNLSTDISGNLKWVLEQKNLRSVFLYLDSQRMSIMAMREALITLVGPSHSHVLPFYACCAMYLDKNGMPLEIRKDKTKGYTILGPVAKKLALMLRSADHFTVNTRQLIGAQAQRTKSLERLGFEIIEVRTSQLSFLDQATEVLTEKLAPHVNLEAIAATRLDTNPDLDRDWLSYFNNDPLVVSDEEDGID